AEITRRVIGHERQPADTHDVIGGDGRQNVVRIDFGERGDRHRICRMEMHDGAGLRPLLIHGAMEKRLLGGSIARNMLARSVELGEARGVEPAERDIGRRHQPAILQPRADIAGAAESEAALEQRRTEATDLLAQIGFAQSRHVKALVKKSSRPKLPDLSASAMVGSPRLAVQGTPGSICGPMRKPEMPSAWTMAPAVSPPATTRRRTPRSTRPRAIAAKALSTSVPA